MIVDYFCLDFMKSQNYNFFAIFANGTTVLQQHHTTAQIMNDLNKKYYKIKEVAEIIGLPASTLRFWESKFTIINPKRNDKGIRFYTPSDIEKLRMVCYLVKEKGLKLEAAQEQIKHNHSGVSRRSDALLRLHRIRETLQTLLDATNSLR